MQQLSKQPAFELGQIVATPGALAALKKAGQQPGEFLTRHVNREWGDLSDEDRNENEYSLEHGFRLLSAYRTHAGDKLWIITESDRSGKFGVRSACLLFGPNVCALTQSSCPRTSRAIGRSRARCAKSSNATLT